MGPAIAVWIFGALTVLYFYHDDGHDMYRPCLGIYIRKPFRWLFRDWFFIAVAWPLVAVWPLIKHIKRNWSH
ncbi:hypothetical protein [Halomonas sp. hl-4]|uniref:hypothetical protein n=1 Tax=Halomonas sp. hl-4 TaxID=1761789 RepID=UPI000BB7E7A1|nr:hypothetical protein [Halomonas sp. hl-4]SNY95547.1 hypothetical protein SAMN04488142_0047 [Halomonas sp. hl-4]